MRNILEIFGVDGELAKEFPVAFDRAQLFFGGGFLFPGAHPLMRSKDPGNGVGAARPAKFPLAVFGPEAGLVAELDDLAFQSSRDLVGRPFGPATVFDQSRRFIVLITPQQFTNGILGTTELAGGSLDAVGPGASNKFLM